MACDLFCMFGWMDGWRDAAVLLLLQTVLIFCLVFLRRWKFQGVKTMDDVEVSWKHGTPHFWRSMGLAGLELELNG